MATTLLTLPVGTYVAAGSAGQALSIENTGKTLVKYRWDTAQPAASAVGHYLPPKEYRELPAKAAQTLYVAALMVDGGVTIS